MSYYFPFATWQCHCWPLDRVQVSVRMLPVRLALCDLEAPGWGEPWFPHCAFVVSWLTDYCMAFLWFCCSALVFLCHTNPWGDAMLSSLLVRFRCPWTDQLITGRAFFWCVFWVFLFVLVGFSFCCLLFFLARWQLNGLCIDPFQFPFVCTLSWLMLPLL